MTEQISFLLFITILSSFASSSAINTLMVSESLSFNQTLISSGQKYEAGFFTPSDSEPAKIYLGIWYYNLTNPKTVVWVANRDNPARNSSVTLTLESDGSGLIVVMEQGVELWASNKSASNIFGPFVQLLDTGNLVIREANITPDDYVWQSFDYPTDTLLPYQKLGWTRNTGLDLRLISWKGNSDPALGNYSLVLIRTGDPDLVGMDGTKTLYRSGAFTGQGVSGIPSMTLNSGINFTLTQNPEEVYYMFDLVDPSIRSRLTMASDGTLSRYTWIPDDQFWNTFWYNPNSPCDRYMSCGAYGVCNYKRLFGCVCPHGFVPRDTSLMSLQDESHGCVRKTGLECGTNGFRVMRNMKFSVGRAATVYFDMGLEKCKKECKKDCNCTAYANARVVGGVGSGCVMWTGDLLDMRTFEEGGEDFYIRLAAADLDHKKTMQVIVGVSVVLAITILAVSASIVRKAKRKQSSSMDESASRMENIHDFQLIGKTTLNKDMLLHNNNKDDSELPLYNFDVMVKATNNFSEENKLGEGGFGSVFKGLFNEVQEIAIKRLSKESKQGFEEFKNEVNLIAKLQHRNLVRLLGYCVDKEEKMLIYEYLRNRSLDVILFNKEKCTILDWKRRFNVICGVARGLMYLHHDSRVRIIHRDLKASNILLDVKISDFGLARIFRGDETETNNTRRVVGTYGYMSPEYAMDGFFSTKSDQELNLLGYDVERRKSLQVVDPSLGDSHRLYEVHRCVEVGLLCVQSKPSERPTMSSVVLMLNNETITLPQPKPPGFYLGWRHEEDEKDVNESVSSINQITITAEDGR